MTKKPPINPVHLLHRLNKRNTEDGSYTLTTVSLASCAQVLIKTAGRYA